MIVRKDEVQEGGNNHRGFRREIRGPFIATKMDKLGKRRLAYHAGDRLQ